MFFSSALKLQDRRTIVLLNKLKLKKPLFQKRRSSCDLRPRKTWLPKSTARFPVKKRWHSPTPVGLSWDFPPPPPESVRAGGQPKFFGSTGYQICLAMELRWRAFCPGSAITFFFGILERHAELFANCFYQLIFMFPLLWYLENRFYKQSYPCTSSMKSTMLFWNERRTQHVLVYLPSRGSLWSLRSLESGFHMIATITTGHYDRWDKTEVYLSDRRRKCSLKCFVFGLFVFHLLTPRILKLWQRNLKDK